VGHSGNGKVVEAVIEEAQALGSEGLKRARAAIDDGDVMDKIDKVVKFVEENAGTIAAVAAKLAGDAAKEGSSAVGSAVGSAAGVAGETAGDVYEAITEDFVKPTVRYGRGIRHGLVIGAAAAILLTPWPGAVVRQKIKQFAIEGLELIDAFRQGALEGAGDHSTSHDTAAGGTTTA
jgi:hypothetical protein